MRRIDDLIRELSPNGVPYRVLSEVGQLKRGTSITKQDVKPGTVPVLAGGRTAAYLHSESNRDGQTIVIAGSGAYAGFVSWWEGPVFVSDAFSVKADESKLLPRYCYHWLSSKQERLHSLKSGGGVPHVYAKDVGLLQIPLPPLEVQREIVQTLDQFAHLEAELAAEVAAEVQARKMQYARYRDALLSFAEHDCEWLTLSDIAIDFGRGKSRHRPRNDPGLYGGRYPFIQTGDVRNSGHLITAYSQTYNEVGLAQSKLWPAGTVCITIAANIAETGILDFAACFPDSVIGLVVKPEKASTDFVEYLLQSLKSHLTAKGKGSAQANINLATFEHERFPFPVLAEQERIVSLLNSFDALVRDVSTDLLAERAARRKQYEHYRDKLLTFEEVPA